MNILVVPGLTMPVVSEATLEAIRAAAGPEASVVVAESYGEALEAIADAEVLLGRIDPRLFAAAPRLRWVHAITAGADEYLFDGMVGSEVLLSGDKGLVGSHLAEHAMGLLLAITRRLARAILDGPASWEHRVEYRREEYELEGLTMGVVGFGGTGKAIAKRAAAFGMHIIAVDCDDVPPTPEVPEVWGADRFEELLRPLGRGRLGAAAHARDLPHLQRPRVRADAPDGAILINVTRGELVDGAALARAVIDGQIAGAGLDVAPQEPLPADHPLWTTPNVVMTPHTAGASQFRIQRNTDRFCRNVEHLRLGEPLEGMIDKHNGY